MGRMAAVASGAMVLVALGGVGYADAPRGLSFRTVGFYGVQLDFADFGYLKFTYTEPGHAERLSGYNALLREARDRGQVSLVGLYTFDRVSHQKPLQEYLANTDALLEGLDRELVYAVCPTEENVTWSKGLEILNALYDRITDKWKLPCYQWLSMPYGPVGKLKADGWVLDAYGYDYDTFRRHLAKFVVTGKPVVVCVNATAPSAKHAAESILPGEPGSAAEAQMRICRESDVPVFFYAVDRTWGNVHAWLRDTDAETAACRRWVFDWIARAHAEAPDGLPLMSAGFLDARPAEVCGGADNAFATEYDFSEVGFLDHAGAEGLLDLRWDGLAEKLLLAAGDEARSARLFWHLRSPLEIEALSASVTGEARGKGARVSIAVGPNILHWHPAALEAQAGTQTLDLTASTPQDWRGREGWVMLELSAPAGGDIALDRLALRGRTLPPAERIIRLEPGPEAGVLYRDDFTSPKLIHFAEVDQPEELQWRPGDWYITGKQGQANRVRVRVHFASERALAEAEVRVDALAWTRDHGASIRMGVSGDGETILAARNTAELPQDERYHRFSGVVSLPLAEVEGLRGAKDFWLIVELVNACGVKAGPSNVLRSLEVVGRAATP